MADLNEITQLVGDIADRVRTAATRAVPAATRLAAIIRTGGVLGFLGGVAGAAGVALPGVGMVRSWALFAMLVAVAACCAVVVWRWGVVLHGWSGDVEEAVARLRALPTPQEAIGRLRETADGLRELAADGGDERSLARVRSLVRSASTLRRGLRRIPGGASTTRDLVREMTGPFRPPMIGIRLVLLAGGLAMVVAGPLMLLVAIVV